MECGDSELEIAKPLRCQFWRNIRTPCPLFFCPEILFTLLFMYMLTFMYTIYNYIYIYTHNEYGMFSQKTQLENVLKTKK